MFRNNKRGQQEGIGLGTLLLLLIGVVVVVVLILFFTGAFDKLSEGVDQLPGNLQAAATSCELAAKSSLVASYCYEFKKLSDTEYSNCLDARIQEQLKAQDVTPLSCTNTTLLDAEKKKICNDAGKKNQTIVFNGNTGECANL